MSGEEAPQLGTEGATPIAPAKISQPKLFSGAAKLLSNSSHIAATRIAMKKSKVIGEKVQNVGEIMSDPRAQILTPRPCSTQRRRAPAKTNKTMHLAPKTPTQGASITQMLGRASSERRRSSL
jgi:hypothetical protein